MLAGVQPVIPAGRLDEQKDFLEELIGGLNGIISLSFHWVADATK